MVNVYYLLFSREISDRYANSGPWLETIPIFVRYPPPPKFYFAPFHFSAFIYKKGDGIYISIGQN